MKVRIINGDIGQDTGLVVEGATYAEVMNKVMQLTPTIKHVITKTVPEGGDHT